MTPSFDLFKPRHQTAPVIFAFPHSGRAYPRALAAQTVLDMEALRSSEDWRVDHLFSGALRSGAICLRARLPRAWVDLNRAPDELDPRLIDGMRQRRLEGRVGSGLGVVPRVVGGGRAIYSGKLARREVDERLLNSWHPYHEALTQAMRQTVQRFGRAILLDCHSMPSEALDRMPPPRPQVVLGDLFGRSASPDVSAVVARAFVGAGFRVARNVPFAGAYIAEQYGRPPEGLHCVQIEIDRALYQQAESPYAPGPALRDLRHRLSPVIEAVVRPFSAREWAAQ